MTINNPIATLQAFSPTAENITGQIQAGQNVMTQGLLQDQHRMVNQGLEQQQNVQNTVNRLQEMERQITFGATPEQLAGTLQGYIQQSQAQGGNPIDSQQALQALQQGGIQGLSNVLGQAKQVFQQQGLIAAPATATQDSAFAKIDPSKFTPESVAVFQSSGQFGDLTPVIPDVVDPVWREELRKELRASTGKLEADAKALKTNFGKLNNLSDEMRAGNRSAVAQGLVSLVKLGDPGSVVKEEELKQALGAQSPIAAVGDLLRGKGVDNGVVNSITQALDPLNPDAVNVDQILATAEAMLKPNIATITSAYDSSKGRAQGHLTEGGFNSIFEGRGIFDEIAGLTFGVQVQESPIVKAQPLTSPGGVSYTVE